MLALGAPMPLALISPGGAGRAFVFGVSVGGTLYVYCDNVP